MRPARVDTAANLFGSEGIRAGAPHDVLPASDGILLNNAGKEMTAHAAKARSIPMSHGKRRCNFLSNSRIMRNTKRMTAMTNAVVAL